MADKGKKDKDKARKQKIKKQEQSAKRELEKQPIKAPFEFTRRYVAWRQEGYLYGPHLI